MVFKVAASLIAKNEIRVWKRCLDSLIYFCDIIVILDTGSTDGSQEFLVKYFKEVGFDNYLLVQDTWVNDFSYSRNKALNITEGEILRAEGLDSKILTVEQFKRLQDLKWYIFVKDIDDDIDDKVSLKKEIQTFTSRAYYMRHGNDMTSGHFMRSFIRYDYKNKFRYTKKIHETLDDATGTEIDSTSFVKSTFIKGYAEGNRSMNEFKYLNDAKVLYEILIKNPFSPRTTYYLAESLRWQGLIEESTIYYRKRAEMEYGYSCERYLSLLRLCYQSDCDRNTKKGFLEQAINLNPDRFEAPTEMMRYLIKEGKYKLAIEYGEKWISKPDPGVFLAVSYSDHSFYLPDLLAKCYKHIGQVDKAKAIWNMLILNNRVLPSDLERVKREVK